MERRVVIVLAGSTLTGLSGCTRLRTASTATPERSTTDRNEPCGPVSSENIRIDSRSNRSHEIRIELRTGDVSERTLLNETRTVPAPDGNSESTSEWIEGVVKEKGTYIVTASLDTGTTESYRWHVSDGCDDLGVEVTPDGELLIGVLPEG